MDRREALIALNLLPDIGPGRLRSLLEFFPEPEKALGAPVSALMRVPRFGEKCAAVLHDWERHCDLSAELLRTRNAGVYIITCEDLDYPAMLKEIRDAPICLYVNGSLEALNKSGCAVAIVGSRMSTRYGSAAAAGISAEACRCGWCVVSGLARGIDTAAHVAAVEAGGCTIAVLGGGFEWIYPRENVPLARKIVETGGAVVSEFGMRFRPDRRNFPMRNRIISGLCRGTIVVEAGLQSGSLITAAQAIEQGRTVFAVPGRIDTPYSSGCHALIRDGARLIESFQDVLDEFSLLPSIADQRRAREERIAAETELVIPVGALEYQLWEAIGDGERSIDSLVEELAQPASAVLGALLTLEIKQLIRQLPGKRVHRCMNRRALLNSG